ncbi:hypothetical protein MMC13_003010 [Lambiella insularis]|nr:hypothetical protein [Lambiella insularis]
MSWVSLASTVVAVEPAAVYNGSYKGTNDPILLRIGNGGAGQSGLIQGFPSPLADAFIDFSISKGESPFKVAWYKSDTTVTINYLQSNIVDVGITYSEIAESLAIEKGIAKSPSYYAFRDHFILVGPPSNPAKISNSSDIETIFSNLYTVAEAANTTIPVRFLSRFDKSATNIKESGLWIAIGQIKVPWATAYSTWYHQYVAFPIQALTAAILLNEYTITDRGTYLSIDSSLQSQATIFKASTDNATDPLLNPAHLLVGAKAAHPTIADKFAKWLNSGLVDLPLTIELGPPRAILKASCPKRSKIGGPDSGAEGPSLRWEYLDNRVGPDQRYTQLQSQQA